MNIKKIKYNLLLPLLFIFCCQAQTKFNLPAHCPVPIKKIAPVYPDILKRVDIEGTVEISVLVNEKGNVDDIIMVRSIPIVDSVCIEAAKKWKFQPGKLALKDSSYVTAKFWFPITFHWGLTENGDQN